MTAQQLKNSILQMAVQGKLVPQNPSDEPASVLLERIREEKAKLVKEGKIKKEKNPSVIFRGADNLPYEKIGRNEPVCIADQVPFEIPESWEWVRLHMLVSKEIRRGKSPKYSIAPGIQVFAQKCNVKAGGIDMSLAKFLEPTAFERYPKEEYLQDQDIIVNSTGNGTLGRIGVFRDSDRIDESIIVPDSHVTVIRLLSLPNKSYLLYVLKYYQPYLEKLGEGSTNQTELRPAFISNLFVPIPPIEEQVKISEKLNKVFPLIEKYGEKESELANYNVKFPDQLKKSILQMSVQGKLVLQDPGDDSAKALLNHIREEKHRLIREEKIKKDKHESIIFRRDNSFYEKVDGIERCIDDEIPFEIPESWEWCRLNSILEKLSDGTHSTPKYVDSGVPFLSVKDISSGIISFDKAKQISLVEHRELYKRCDPHKGDILLTKVGTTGIPVIVNTDVEFSLFVSVALLRFSQKYIDAEYLLLLLKSPLVQKQCARDTKGVGNKNWVMRDIANTLIALPPLVEQKRIVKFYQSIEPCIQQIYNA